MPLERAQWPAPSVICDEPPFPASAVSQFGADSAGTNRVALTGLVLAVAASTVLCLHLTQGAALGADEYWFFVVNHGFQLKGLLSPQAGNLIFVVRLAYAAVFALWGPDFLVLRLIEVVLVDTAAALVFVLLRRRIPPIPALAFTLPLLFLGATFEVTLSSNGINIVLAVVEGLAALLALEARTRRGDLLACALLTLALATFSVGFAFVAAAIVSVLLDPRRWRRAYVVVVPLVLYAAWAAFAPRYTGPGYLHTAPLRLANVTRLPAFAARAAASDTAAISGLYYPFGSPRIGPLNTLEHYGVGFVLAALGLVVAAIGVVRRRTRPELWVFAGFVLAFWASIVMVIAFDRLPNSTRYLYAGAIGLLLVAAETLRSRRWPPAGVLAVAALSAASLVFNIAELSAAGAQLRLDGGLGRAVETGMDLTAGHVRRNFFPSRANVLGALYNTAGGVRPYLAAAHRWGSPGLSLDELRLGTRPERSLADITVSWVEALGLRSTPARGCHTLPPGRTTVSFRAPGLVLVPRAGGPVSLGRFAPPAYVIGTTRAGRPVRLAVPVDPTAVPEPWRVRVPGGVRSLCAR